MIDLSGFVASEHAGAGSREVLPPGWYLAQITGQETRSSGRGDSEALNFTWSILGTHTNGKGETGEAHRGRLVWSQHTLAHTCNPKDDAARASKMDQAVSISMRDVAHIMNAIGLPSLVQGAGELLHKPLLLRLTIESGGGQYEDKNKVAGFKAAKGGAPAPGPFAAPGGAPAPFASPGGNGGAPAPQSPPWMEEETPQRQPAAGQPWNDGGLPKL